MLENLNLSTKCVTICNALLFSFLGRCKAIRAISPLRISYEKCLYKQTYAKL